MNWPTIAPIAGDNPLGLALAAGKLTASVISAKTGATITVTISAKCKNERDKWVSCPLAEADRLFCDSGAAEVGRVHTAGRYAGRLVPPWQTELDPARAWATKRVLDCAAGRCETRDDLATVVLDTWCLRCGEELPEEHAARGFDAKCWRLVHGAPSGTITIPVPVQPALEPISVPQREAERAAEAKREAEAQRRSDEDLVELLPGADPAAMLPGGGRR